MLFLHFAFIFPLGQSRGAFFFYITPLCQGRRIRALISFRLFPLGRSFFKPSFSQKYSLHHPDTGRT
jgi:hypothetical protein